MEHECDYCKRPGAETMRLEGAVPFYFHDDCLRYLGSESYRRASRRGRPTFDLEHIPSPAQLVELATRAAGPPKFDEATVRAEFAKLRAKRDAEQAKRKARER